MHCSWIVKKKKKKNFFIHLGGSFSLLSFSFLSHFFLSLWFADDCVPLMIVLWQLWAVDGCGPGIVVMDRGSDGGDGGLFIYLFFVLWFVVVVLVQRGSWVINLLGLCVWLVLVHRSGFGSCGFWFGVMGLLVGLLVGSDWGWGLDRGCWGGGRWLWFCGSFVVGFGCGLCCGFFIFFYYKFWWLGVEVVVGGGGYGCGYGCGRWWQWVLAVAVGLLVVKQMWMRIKKKKKI